MKPESDFNGKNQGTILIYLRKYNCYMYMYYGLKYGKIAIVINFYVHVIRIILF